MTLWSVYDNMVNSLFYILKESPEILKWVTVLADPIQDTLDCCEYIIGQDSIDNSDGQELDYIGTILKTPRPAKLIPQNELFTLYDEKDTGDFDYKTGFADDDDPVVGGYLSSDTGLMDGTEARMIDADYRILLKQKSKLLRRKMTHENLYNYLLEFDARCVLNDGGTLTVEIEPINDADLTDWERWYILNKGFKPAGVKVEIQDRLNGALPL